VHLTVPRDFVASLSEHTYPVVLTDADGYWRYQADLGVERVGYRPGTDERLPTTADDPAVYDSDRDGHPGATLRLSVVGILQGKLFIVQRGRSLLDGRIVAPGRVEGSIDTPLFEQAVLDAQPAFLARRPEITLEPGRSRFILSQASGARTCADLVDPKDDTE
jgi:hypothetical protein